MIVGSMRVTLRLHAANSLKEKRFVVQSVKRRLKNRFNVSVAEISEQDQWRSAQLGMASVGQSRVMVERELQAVRRFLDADVRFEMIDVTVEYV
jgi:uncharacterized protein YlxP (DUF503 family)